MQIRVTCPHCRKSFQIPERFAGRDGECSNCQQVFHIPELAPKVSDSEGKRRSGSTPAGRSKTPDSSGTRDAGMRRSRPPARDPDMTEEIRVYAVEPSDEFEAAASSRGDSEKSDLPNEPVFDITDADLLPDDDDADSGHNELESELAADAGDEERDSEASSRSSSSSEIVRKRSEGSNAAVPRAGSSAEVRSSKKPRRSNRAADDNASSLQSSVNAEIESTKVSDAGSDALEISEPLAAVPVLRRRRLGEQPSREKRSSKESVSHRDAGDDVKKEDDFELGDGSEQSRQGPAGATDRKRLRIFGGAGAMLLIVAGVYSQFSGPPSATMPVVVSGPADVSGEPSAMEQAEIGLPSVADSEAPARESSTATGSESGDEIIPAKPPTSLAAAAPLPVFPQLPEPKSSAANGFSYYEIELGGASTSAADSEATSEAAPGTRMRLILYLPPGEHADGSLSCVLVAPAGTSLLEGADCFDDSYRDETLPYVEAGFAVVGYSLDGALEFDQPTDAELNTAYRQFRAAQAGLINARNALEFVLARVPQVAPDQIYSAGHSSAGTLSLLFAAHEPRLAGSIAYAPCTDPENRLASLLDNPAINRMMPGVSEFVRFESPLRKAGRITCPVFLFHAEDDSNVPVAESRAFAERLAEAGNEPALKLVAAGGHDDAMINSGIPAAIEWLKQQMLAKRAGST